MQLSFDIPYDIQLDHDPYDSHTTRYISTKGTHPTLGFLISTNKDNGKIRIDDIHKSTPAARIPRWVTEIKHGVITKVDDIQVKTVQDVIKAIKNARAQNKKTIKINISTMNKQSMNPQTGTPQIYHDQMNIIAQHLWEIKNIPTKYDETIITLNKVKFNNGSTKILQKKTTDKLKTVIKSIDCKKIPKKLTRRYLTQQNDWTDWKNSEYKNSNSMKIRIHSEIRHHTQEEKTY